MILPACRRRPHGTFCTGSTASMTLYMYACCYRFCGSNVGQLGDFGDERCTHCKSSSDTCSCLQGLRVEASSEAFWRWLGSSAGALPLSLWEAAAAQKLPTEVLAAADADRENHCRQAFSMVSTKADHCRVHATFTGHCPSRRMQRLHMPGCDVVFGGCLRPGLACNSPFACQRSGCVGEAPWRILYQSIRSAAVAGAKHGGRQLHHGGAVRSSRGRRRARAPPADPHPGTSRQTRPVMTAQHGTGAAPLVWQMHERSSLGSAPSQACWFAFDSVMHTLRSWCMH